MARPSTTVQAISDFIAGCKTDGVWSKITEAYLMAGVTFGGITVKLKGTGTLTNNNFVSGDYQATGAGAGLSGDGSTKYLDTGLNDNTLSADDKSFGVYCTARNTSGGYLIVSRDSNVLMIWDNVDRIDFSLPNSDARYEYSNSDVSYFLASRRNINDVEFYQNGTSVATDTTTSTYTPDDANWWIFRGQTLSFGASDATLTFAHIGTGLTDADASNLTNRVETLMDALGCGVIS